MSDLRELEKSASPAPWQRSEPGPIPEGSTQDGERHDHGWAHHPCYDIADGVLSSWGHDADGVMATDADIDLIVAMRNALPDLLDALEAARDWIAQESGDNTDVLDVIEKALGRRLAGRTEDAPE